jgi:UTP:GlnB (protein PII) uridylyltransferase
MSVSEASPPSLLQPLTSPDEIAPFLKRVPVALDPKQFSEFVLGFPRRYLELTPGVEVVRHFALMNGLGSRAVISSLSPEEDAWRVSVVARDRQALFSGIAGSLSAFALDIVSAEGFANANAIVLDTFICKDGGGQFQTPANRRSFQVFLERVVSGSLLLDPVIERLALALAAPRDAVLDVSFDDEPGLPATRVVLRAADRFGLLYFVSRAISRAGCDIELADIATPDGTALDTFYVTRAGLPLDEPARAALREAILHCWPGSTKSPPVD